MARYKRKKKKGLYSKILITCIVILNVLFTLAVLYVFKQTAEEPTALVTAWFAFTTGELWMTASIKKAKTKANTEVFSEPTADEEYTDAEQ